MNTACRVINCAQGAGPHATHLAGPPRTGDRLAEVRHALRRSYLDLLDARARWADRDAGRAVAYQTGASAILRTIDLIDQEQP